METKPTITALTLACSLCHVIPGRWEKTLQDKISRLLLPPHTASELSKSFWKCRCVEHWWGKSWHWREGSLGQILGSCLGKAFSQLRVAYPLGTRLWPDLFVPTATISSVTPSKVQSGFRVLWLYVYICHGDQSLISCLYLSVFHSDSVVRHWILWYLYPHSTLHFICPYVILCRSMCKNTFSMVAFGQSQYSQLRVWLKRKRHVTAWIRV